MRLVPLNPNAVPNEYRTALEVLLNAPSVQTWAIYKVEGAIGPIVLTGEFQASPASQPREVSGEALLAILDRTGQRGPFQSVHIILPSCSAQVALSRTGRAFISAFEVSPEAAKKAPAERIRSNGAYVNFLPLLLNSESRVLLGALGPQIETLLSGTTESQQENASEDDFAG
jgi:hypothetical protein